MKYHLRHRCSPLAVAGLFALITVFAQADVGDMTTINITGTLVDAPECTVNSNNKVDVDFGDALIARRVDGVNYKKAIGYTLSCSSIASNGMKIAISGTAAAFGSGLIRTDKADLGIQLYRNTDKVSNGAEMMFTYPNIPVLYAVPVARDASTLTAGTFSGTASMIISYQ